MSSLLFHIRWVAYKEEISNYHFNFKVGDFFTDTTIWCKDSSNSVRSIKCHKLLLLMSSLYFRAMLLQNPEKEPELHLDDGFLYEDVKAILDFVYNGEIKVSDAKSFIEVGQKLQVRGLFDEFDSAATVQKSSVSEDSDHKPSGQSLSPEDEKENGREKEEAKLETGNGDEEMKVEIESPEKEADSGIEKSEPSETVGKKKRPITDLDSMSQTVPAKKKVPKEKNAATEAANKKDPNEPNLPKKPLSAYIYFSMEETKRVREINPGLNFADISKEVGRLWNVLDENGRAPFEALANADKERYNVEMVTVSPTALAKTKMAKEKKDQNAQTETTQKKDPKAPKKPQTAYQFFKVGQTKELRGANPAISCAEATKEISARWAQMGTAERRPWEDLAVEDKRRYETETAAYKED